MISGTDYNPYYDTYIKLVIEKQLLPSLREGMTNTISFFSSLSADKHAYRYAEGKWTPKEVFLHLIDTERVFMYRAMQFARANNVVLEGFDQDVFVENSNANARVMNDLVAEYEAVRMATVAFIGSCSEDTLARKGVASDHPLSVRAAAYLCSGHEIHHIQVIKERYLG
ncbi:MAG: hypothetical protein ACI86C_000702 [Candidatus Latescibacterota bacterium]|jgi:hypothetical protein